MQKKFGLSAAIVRWGVSIRGRLIGSFVVFSSLTLAASALSYFSFQQVGDGFRQLQSESLPQLDQSLVVARLVNDITVRVSMIASADGPSRLPDGGGVTPQQQNVLASSLAILRSKGADDREIETIRTSFEDLSGNTSMLLESKVKQFELRAEREKGIADARAAFAAAVNSMGPIAESSANQLEHDLQAASQSGNAAPTSNTDKKFREIRNSWLVFSEANAVMGLYSELASVQSATALKLAQGRFSSSAQRIGAALLELPSELQIDDLKSASDKLLAPGLTHRTIFVIRSEEMETGKQLINYVQQNQQRVDRLAAEIDSLVARVKTESSSQIHASGERIQLAELYLAVLAIFSVIVSVAIAWRYVLNNLLRRLSMVHSAVSALSAGEFDFTLRVGSAHAARNDELDEIAKSVAVFRENAIAKVEAEKDASDQRKTAELERMSNSQKSASASEELKGVVETLSNSMALLAVGNLGCTITQAFPRQYEQLRGDFNRAVESLATTISLITCGSDRIRQGSGEISEAAALLAGRAESQAASLEETAAALSEVTQNQRRTADGATRAQEIVHIATSDARRSAEVVRNAIEAMSQIASSSEQISQIIGIIDQIAFQTNLLALNAGVEAARAGEAGRGFAVVASEVRMLAQRSAEAAKEISQLIVTSSGQVGDGVKMVAETEDVINRIGLGVAQINEVIRTIAGSSQEQAAALSEISTTVHTLDQVTQQVAAMADTSSVTSTELASEAVELDRLTAMFALPEVRDGVHLAAA
jgi:methyl-accepting chemotaxis protein